MSEIKSTLDLVMEKTKHLSMSGEEKNHGIEGSAVVCNPEKDASYLEDLAALREETRNRIEKISQKAA